MWVLYIYKIFFLKLERYFGFRDVIVLYLVGNVLYFVFSFLWGKLKVNYIRFIGILDLRVRIFFFFYMGVKGRALRLGDLRFGGRGLWVELSNILACS